MNTVGATIGDLSFTKIQFRCSTVNIRATPDMSFTQCRMSFRYRISFHVCPLVSTHKFIFQLQNVPVGAHLGHTS